MTADTFQFKRGTTAKVNAYLPAVGEPVYDTTLKQFKIGDGVTLGGVAPTLTYANLNALQGLTGAADTLAYFTGVGAMAGTPLTAVARALLDDTTVTAQRATLGLTKTTSTTDTTAGSVLQVGDFGNGSLVFVPTWPNTSINDCTGVGAGMYRAVGGTTNLPAGYSSSSIIQYVVRDNTITRMSQIVTEVVGAAVAKQCVRTCSGGTLAAPTWGAFNDVVFGGANSSITSLTGLTTPLSIAQGGTGNGTGLAATATALATSRSISTTGDATWTVNFNGTANATAAITLASVGSAGTYGSVTTDAKGRVTAGSVVTPVANGGTGQATAALAALDLAVPKLAWAPYTPTVTATTGTFTTASATGKSMVQNGICHFQAVVTITTKGTGTLPIITLPFAALTGSANMPIPARENVVNGKGGFAFIAAGLTTATCIGADATELATANGAVIYINGSYPIA
jgi:hypothetical protein